MLDNNYFVSYDCEVYPEFFCFVFKDKRNGRRVICRSDEADVMTKLIAMAKDTNAIYVGYNIKGYDLKIWHAVMTAFWEKRPISEICAIAFNLSEQIIEDDGYVRTPNDLVNYTDLNDDLGEFLSLKEYESNKGLEIKETDIPFGKRNLSKVERDLIVSYCIKDVDATETMLDDRFNYVMTKARVSSRFRMNPLIALKMTDPSLASAILVPTFTPPNNVVHQPTYELPSQVADYLQQTIEPALLNTFMDYAHFSQAKKEWLINNNDFVIGEGGIHSIHHANTLANKNGNGVLYVEAKAGYVLLTIDVKSYYPHLMVNFDYQSRSIPDKTIYPRILETRMKNKELLENNPNHPDKKAIKQNIDDDKLILNSTGGALKQKYLKLYDPEQNMRMCFTGQLLLIALCNELSTQCHADIIQTNTDGIALRLPYSERRHAYSIIRAWEKRTNMQFDYGVFNRLWQSNVNNYVMIYNNGKVKNCGWWLSYDIDPFHNLKFLVIRKAIFEYLVNGTPVETTIRAETNPLMFMQTAKRGRTFAKTLFVGAGNTITELGKVNRIYASNSRRLGGKLYKEKSDGTRRPVPKCPTLARTYNEAVTSLPTDLDYNWYIQEARHEIDSMVRADLP